MRRIWFGVGVLVFLLVLGFGTSALMERIHTPISRLLLDASRQEDFSRACRLSQQAEKHWQKHRRFTASLSEHQELDRIESLFAQLEVSRHRGDSLGHATTCAALSKDLSALVDVHQLTWWNLL